MGFNRKHLKNIISANNHNSLAIFIGAGISKSSDTKYLNWNELIAQLKEDLGLDDSESDNLKIAQLYYLEFGEHSYYKKIKSFFPDYEKPSKLHKIIFEITPHIIITTNWDRLLETTIENNAFIFDTIASDTELVKSSLQNKVIKMHGDFRHNNIVFKEDDFIQYQLNFPLMENFVKSILSTHTILFLGYSYNDINLKQILKWIQFHSSDRPPMYYISLSPNKTQNIYLENHGITVLELSTKDHSKPKPNEYTDVLFSFLNQIKNNEDSETISSDTETINFVLNRLINLDRLESILFEQVRKALSNCGFEYEFNSEVALRFYTVDMTFDYNIHIREIYQVFTRILDDLNLGKALHPKILKIFKILRKAGISKIVSKNLPNRKYEFLTIGNYLDFEKNDGSEPYFNFNFEVAPISISSPIEQLYESAFNLYQIQRFEEAYARTEEVINISLKQRNYKLMLLAMFNWNILLRILKLSLNLDWKKYSEIREYDIQGRFFSLSKDLQIALEPIFGFVTRSFWTNYTFNSSEELREKEKSKKTIEGGGFVFQSDNSRTAAEHKNLIQFVLRNNLMVENFLEFKRINMHFLEIATIRQIQKSKTTLNRMEIFSSIKYLDSKDLKALLKEFYHPKAKRKGDFEISSEDKIWLINIVLENIINKSTHVEILYHQYNKYIENIIFLLSLVKLEGNEIDALLNTFSKIIARDNNTYEVFEAINEFFGNQFVLYKTVVKEKVLLEIIESLIQKIVDKRNNGYEFHALADNKIYNLFGYVEQSKVIMNNEKLVSNLIAEIKEKSIYDKMRLSQRLLLNIFYISNSKIRARIRTFMRNVNVEEEKDWDYRIEFKLTLISSKFKQLDKSTIKEIERYLKEFKNSRFSTALYRIGDQIKYLIDVQKAKDLQKLSKKIDLIIDEYQKNKHSSIF